MTYGICGEHVRSNCEETLKIGAHVLPIGVSLEIVPSAIQEYRTSCINFLEPTPAGFDFEASRHVYIEFSKNFLGITTQDGQYRPSVRIAFAGRQKIFEDNRLTFVTFLKDLFAPVNRFRIAKNKSRLRGSPVNCRRYFSDTPRKCWGAMSTIFRIPDATRPPAVRVPIDFLPVLTGPFSTKMVPKGSVLIPEGPNKLRFINEVTNLNFDKEGIKFFGGIRTQGGGSGHAMAQSTVERIALARNLEALQLNNSRIREICLSRFSGQFLKADAIIKYSDSKFLAVDGYTPVSTETKYESMSSTLKYKQKAALALDNPSKQQTIIAEFIERMENNSRLHSSDVTLHEREFLLEFCESLNAGYPPHLTLADLAAFSDLERKAFVK